MKFQIDKKELLEALKSVQPAIANRSSLPILSGIKLEASGGRIKLEASGGRIKLEATDLEFAIGLEIPAETSNGRGRAVVPGKNFLKSVKAMADSMVEVEIKDDNDRKLR